MNDAHRSGRGLILPILNKLATWVSGHEIADLTSGFRAVRAKFFRRFIYMLPNGFSYPTTSTMAFFRAGYSVTYIPIECEQRLGGSHINLLKDGVCFLLIIFKIGTLYAPIGFFSLYQRYSFLQGSAITSIRLLRLADSPI